MLNSSKEIINLLIEKIDQVVPVIYPQARISGGKAYVGDIDGTPGKSLVIELAGEKAGVWSDFASGEKGDIIELWIKGKCSGDNKKAFQEIREFLHLPPPIREVSKFQLTEKDYDKPDTSQLKKLTPTSLAYSYLTGDRRIEPRELKASRVRQSRDGASYSFVYEFPEDCPCLIKHINVARVNGKKKSWTSKNSRPVLFGMYRPLQDNKFPGVVAICEGEVDALTLRQCGVFAVSVPYGAKNHMWIPHCHNFLQRFTDIVLFFDGDEEGRAGSSGLSEAIGNSSCRVVDTPEGEDANSIFIKDGQEKLLELIKNSKRITPEKFTTASAIASEAWNVIERGPISSQGDPFLGWDEPWNSVNWKLRKKELTIWTGFPCHGKSLALYQMIAYLVCVLGQTVAIASLEVPGSEIVVHIANTAFSRQLTESDKGRFMEFLELFGDRIIIYDFLGTAPFEEVLDFAEYSCNVAGADHFILDSITKTSLNVEDLAETNEFISRVTASMFSTGAHYHVVAHSRKSDSTDISKIPGIDQIKGSGSIGAETFNVITVWRNVKKEEKIQEYIDGAKDLEEAESNARELYSGEPDAFLVISKQKNSRHLGKYPLWYDIKRMRFKRRYQSLPGSYIECEIDKKGEDDF